MATAGIQNFSNKVSKRVATNKLFADASNLAGTLTCTQGDLVCLDTTNNVLSIPGNETAGNTFLGIMPVSLSSGKLPKVYQSDTDSSVGQTGIPGPEFGDEYFVMLKGGDSAVPGSKLYLYPNPSVGNNFVSVSGTKVIGVYGGPSITAATGGQEISAKLGARYPDDSFKA